MISWETPFGRQNIKGFCDPGSLGSHGIFIKSFPPSPLQVTQPQTACRGMAGVTESEWKWNSTTSDLDFLWTLIWTRNSLLKCDSRGLSGARDSTTFHHVEQKVTRASRPRELSFRKGIPSSNERCGGNTVHRLGPTAAHSESGKVILMRNGVALHSANAPTCSLRPSYSQPRGGEGVRESSM